MNMSLLTLYWPGSRPISEEFFNDVTDLLEHCSQYSQFCVVGDINVRCDDATSTRTSRLQQLLDEFGLQERVQQPIHKCRHHLTLPGLVQWHDPTFSRNLAWSINNHFYAFFNSS